MPRGVETILLVEDESAVRRLWRQSLESCRYTVLEAAHGSEALNLCQNGLVQIDLLITDVVMPLMSGRELAERLLVLRPGTMVLYVSGYTEDSIVRHGIAQDEVAFLAKPFLSVSLAQKVREVLDAPQKIARPAFRSRQEVGSGSRPATWLGFSVRHEADGA